MPPRPNPTTRQARLGAELRKLRESAGIESRDAAEFLSTNQTQISHIESGRFGISEERLRRLAELYDCVDRQLLDALVEMAGSRGKGWWEKYRGVVRPKGLDLAELEHYSTYVRTFQALHIPGLLQTEEYIRTASLFTSPELPERDREDRVEFRLRRQQVLNTGRPYQAVIHEAALRMRVGGPKAARTQLDRILRESERESVTVRVIPFTADDFAGAGQSMLYVGGKVPQLDTAQVDTGNGSLFVDASAKLHRYRARLARIDSTALEPTPSRDLVRAIARDL
ncbi:Scr1 family TA system antitoxin-like transcriptional regulator [Streptomyces fagopyri]|uniref:Scr1 family TA system antitoxin-like transcriptional regulator n=1 Tax=Streptomyces fagopyri TaxID=2662397 RepID=UPI00368BBFCC